MILSLKIVKYFPQNKSYRINQRIKLNIHFLLENCFLINEEWTHKFSLEAPKKPFLERPFFRSSRALLK